MRSRGPGPGIGGRPGDKETGERWGSLLAPYQKPRRLSDRVLELEAATAVAHIMVRSLESK